MILKSDKIITPKGLFSGYVTVENGKIKSVTSEKPQGETLDFTGKYLSPGFIDMHTHGAGGFAFVNSSADEVVNGCNYHLNFGTTSILPTISASPFADMEKAVSDIAEAKRSGKCKANIIGAHLEGPYLSTNQCGAQCTDYITAPKSEEYLPFLEKWGSEVARWTYAPENDDGSFCKAITSRGIIASAGHTDAKYEDMARAIDSGCSLITHLYSCTSTVTRDKGFRSLGVIESAYLRDELFVEIIADGKHLPPDLIKMILKVKGKEKVALITDSLHLAGTDVKEGFMAGTHFIIEEGVCRLYDRSAFAGSIATADRLVRVLVREVGESIVDSVKMLTEVPAKILKLNKGKIEPTYDADLIVFDENISVSSVFVGGTQVK